MVCEQGSDSNLNFIFRNFPIIPIYLPYRLDSLGLLIMQHKQ
jgi:hypothetical protein